MALIYQPSEDTGVLTSFEDTELKEVRTQRKAFAIEQIKATTNNRACLSPK